MSWSSRVCTLTQCHHCPVASCITDDTFTVLSDMRREQRFVPSSRLGMRRARRDTHRWWGPRGALEGSTAPPRTPRGTARSLWRRWLGLRMRSRTRAGSPWCGILEEIDSVNYLVGDIWTTEKASCSTLISIQAFSRIYLILTENRVCNS